MAGPAGLRDQAVAIGKQFAEAETKLAAAVADRLSRGITQPGWTEAKLAEVQALRNELSGIIAATAADATGSVADLMKSAYASGAGTTVPAGSEEGVAAGIGGMNVSALSALYAATYDRIDAGGSLMLRSTMDSYRSIVAEATAAVVSGTDTRLGATQAALNAFAAQGVTGFTDSAGRAWSMSAYAEMATRTAATRSFLEGKLDTFRAAGITMFQISSDGSPCDLCAPWEGVIVADDGADNPEGLPTLSDAEADGVWHANCGHTADAVSDAAKDLGLVKDEKMSEDELAQARENYDNAQQQRYMERQVQDWKTRDAVAITPEANAQAEAKIAEWQGKLREFTQSTGLPRYYDREGLRIGVADAPTVVPEPAVAGPPFRATSEAKASEYGKSMAVQLSTPEWQAVEDYASNSYGAINTALRSGFLDTSLKEAVGALDSAIAKETLPQNTILFRGAWGSQLGVNMETMTQREMIDKASLMIGKTYIEPAYTSTSLNEAGAFSRPVNFIIEAPAGQNALYIAGEYEVLLPRDVVYVVDRVEARGPADRGGSSPGRGMINVYIRVVR